MTMREEDTFKSFELKKIGVLKGSQNRGRQNTYTITTNIIIPLRITRQNFDFKTHFFGGYIEDDINN